MRPSCIYLHVCLKAGLHLQSRNCFTLVFFTTVCGKPQHMANHPVWVAPDIKASSPAKLPAPQHGEGWSECSRKLRLLQAGWWKRDHLRAGTSARLGGSANLSCSFKSTFLNVLPWGQRNSQNKHEFFRRMECVYCCSLRHKGGKKGYFLISKKIFLVQTSSNTSRQTHREIPIWTCMCDYHHHHFDRSPPW